VKPLKQRLETEEDVRPFPLLRGGCRPLVGWHVRAFLPGDPDNPLASQVVCWFDIQGGMGAGQNHLAEMLEGIRKCTVRRRGASLRC
jgi:hypothetical protein